MALVGTSLEILYSVFGVQKNDAELCTRMANVGVIYTVITALFTLYQPAPYGRFSKEIYGATINAKLGWMVQECMAFICPALMIVIIPGSQLNNYSNIIAIVLFLLHYFHRSFIYPLKMSSDSKPTPLLTVVAAIVFCTFNGLMQGVHLIHVFPVQDSINVFIGSTLFLIGMSINVTHDRMLIALREKPAKPSNKVEGKSRYKIPRGGLFEYVSGANYLGEIIEWTALALITQGYPQIVFAIFSTTFLGMRAIQVHRFYKETFGDSYPQSRKAIVPFLI